MESPKLTVNIYKTSIFNYDSNERGTGYSTDTKLIEDGYEKYGGWSGGPSLEEVISRTAKFIFYQNKEADLNLYNLEIINGPPSIKANATINLRKLSSEGRSIIEPALLSPREWEVAIKNFTSQWKELTK